MAWVRIHDGAMTHPKVIGLCDKAFRLWVWGLCYAQQHLTDGRLVDQAVPRRLRRAAEKLVTAGLWEREKDGYQIHDYTKWNDDRKTILQKREAAKERMTKFRGSVRANDSQEQTPNFSECSSVNVPCTSGYVGGSSSEKGSGEKQPDPMKKRRFMGQRLTIFEWQHESHRKTLGSHADSFDLDTWYRDFDASIHPQQVIPKKNADWLDAQLVIEARKRGLPIADASTRKPMFSTPVEDDAKRVLEKIKQHDALIAGIQ